MSVWIVVVLATGAVGNAAESKDDTDDAAENRKPVGHSKSQGN